MHKQLKIGFILHGDYVPAWYAETIALLQKENHCLYFLSFQLQAKNEVSKPLVHRLFSAFEEKWFRPEHDAKHAISVREVIADNILLNFKKAGYWLEENELEGLRHLNLDFFYTIGFYPAAKENISPASTFGLWYVHFGFGEYRNSNEPAFWEVMDHSPVAGSYLLMRKDNSDYILYEGTTNAVPFSVKNTFNAVAWKSASYLPHRARTLAALPASFTDKYNRQLVWKNIGKCLPGNSRMAFFFVQNVLRYVRYKRKLKRNADRFTLLFSQERLPLEALATTSFRPVALPAGHFFADPFVIEKEGVQYVFFEEYSDAKQKAHISLIEIDQDGNVSPVKTALERPYHLSYPFVFTVQGDYYMVPETSANGTVELYKATAFPSAWEFVMNLTEGKALIDSTLFFKDGKWWLFAAQSNHPSVSTNDQLFLYYSDNLFSANWKPHPMNPIATHAGNCRPAGRIFQREGKLYRPAQNNASLQYGFGLNINEIETLTTEAYSERLVHSIHPEQLGLKAIHHLDFSANLTIIDGIVKNGKS